MAKILIKDPANPARDGWHELYGNNIDAIAGNLKMAFLTSIPLTHPTSSQRQPDDWSCGAFAIAEALNVDGEIIRKWLMDRGLITSAYGTDHGGVVKCLNAYGYSCSWDGKYYNGDKNAAILPQIEAHLKKGFKVILLMGGTLTNAGGKCSTNYWSYRGHYTCAYGINGSTPTQSNKLTVDGIWGKDTTIFVQKILKTGTDGIVSGQAKSIRSKLINCSTASWEFCDKPTGSALIRAIQKKIGVVADGIVGDVTIKTLQAYLKVTSDGIFGYNSVCAFQKWLNSLT